MARLYPCSTAGCFNMCGPNEDEDWSEADARAELKANFPPGQAVPENCAIVCDDCYKAILAHYSINSVADITANALATLRKFTPSAKRTWADEGTPHASDGPLRPGKPGLRSADPA